MKVKKIAPTPFYTPAVQTWTKLSVSRYKFFRSLARLLTLYDGIQLRYVPCAKGLGMPKEVRDYVASKGVSQADYRSVDEAIADTDILYVTRIQRERFSSEEEYRTACENYVVNDKR